MVFLKASQLCILLWGWIFKRGHDDSKPSDPYAVCRIIFNKRLTAFSRCDAKIKTMQFEASNLYHIYNRGNNKQPIFFNRDNYLYFLTKVKKHIASNCDILAWCLMPNHFHFLVHANISTVKIVKENPIKINALTEGLRLLLIPTICINSPISFLSV